MKHNRGGIVPTLIRLFPEIEFDELKFEIASMNLKNL